MFKREEEGTANKLGAAPSAFLQLSDEARWSSRSAIRSPGGSRHSC